MCPVTVVWLGCSQRGGAWALGFGESRAMLMFFFCFFGLHCKVLHLERGSLFGLVYKRMPLSKQLRERIENIF